jgi:hypothetical protein
VGQLEEHLGHLLNAGVNAVTAALVAYTAYQLRQIRAHLDRVKEELERSEA